MQNLMGKQALNRTYLELKVKLIEVSIPPGKKIRFKSIIYGNLLKEHSLNLASLIL